MDAEFVQELYNQVKKLDAKGVKWMMTQADTPDVINQFSEYNVSKFAVYRNITQKSKFEVLIKNY